MDKAVTKKIPVIVVYVDERGSVLESYDNSSVDVPVGEENKYNEYIPQHFLSSVENKSATYESDGVQLPTGKIDWSKATFVGLNKDSTITFKFIRNQNQETTVRKQYTTTWNNGYVEPPVSELINLFPNVRAAKYLENESTQSVKAFEIIYNNGFKGRGFVDISIEPKREKVVGINKSIDYRGDDEKDLGYRNTEEGVNPSHDVVKSYTADSNGIFHESVTTENDVPARNAIVTLGTKPTVKTETITKGKRYEADPNQVAKGQETVVTPGQDGVKTSTTRYTVNPTTGDITSNTTVETTEKIDTVIKVGNKEFRTEAVAITTRYVADPNMEAGQKHTDDGEAGENQITTTYVVDSATGSLSNPQESTTQIKAMRERVIRVGTKHVEVTETPVTIRYEADENSIRDTRTKIQDGIKGVHTKTTTYQINSDGSLHSPVVVDNDVPMTETIIKVGIKPLIETINTPMTTRYVYDSTLDVNEERIDEQGSDGHKVITTTYSLNTSTGVTSEVAPFVKNTPMVERVIRIGTKITPPTLDIPEYTDPVGGAGLDGEGNLITPPTLDIPEYTDPVGGAGLDGEGNLITPPTLDIPEYTDPVVSTQVNSSSEKIERKQLPKTGDVGALISLSGLGVSLVGVGMRRKREE